MINLSFFRRHPSDTTSEKDDPGDGEETRSSYPVLAGIVAALREAGRRSVARKPLAVTTQAFARFRPFRVVRVRVVRDGGRGFLPAGSEKTCKQTLFSFSIYCAISAGRAGSRRSSAPSQATKHAYLQDVYNGSDGTRTRDLQRDRPVRGLRPTRRSGKRSGCPSRRGVCAAFEGSLAPGKRGKVVLRVAGVSKLRGGCLSNEI